MICSDKRHATPAKIAGLEVERIINEPTAGCVGIRLRKIQD
jgi:molecular chaperone DnaK (HSP70)